MHAVLIALTAFAAPSSITQADVVNAMVNMQGYYKAGDGEWGNSDWWHSGNVLEALCNSMMYTNDSRYLGVVEETWEKTGKKYDTHKKTEGYDDVAWWGLAWVRAAVLTGDKKYLERSKGYYEEVDNAWDDVCGGGVWWNRAKTYKNSITNELYATLSTQLYLQTNNKTYLENALKSWNWFSNSSMWGALHSPIVDGLTSTCGPSGPAWTYNQGVILGALSDLYTITKDEKYLEFAFEKTVATVENMTANGVLQEPAAGQGKTTDAEQFKGVFVRYIGYLLRRCDEVSLPRHLREDLMRLKGFLADNAGGVLVNDVDGKGRFGFLWQGPPNKPDYITHCSGFDLVTAAYGTQ